MLKWVAFSLVATLWVVAGSAASAANGTVRLGVEALGSDKPYFDISLEPGESIDLTARFSNHGDVGTVASVYAANVYTIPGGGMGMSGLGEPLIGPTRWLTFEAGDIELGPAGSVEQTFTVSVPTSTEPGDYITAIAMQNTEPLTVDGENQQFNQTIRTGIAVAIDVPGPRTPGLEIGDIEHADFGGRSIVMMGIENTGNVHLRPEGQFTLDDDTGATVVDAPFNMDTVYAGTHTVLEFPLDSRLEPGTYEVELSLIDPQSGVEATIENVALDVPVPTGGSRSARVDSTSSDATLDVRAAESESSDLPILIAGAVGAVGVGGLLMLWLLRRRVRAQAALTHRAEVGHSSPSSSSPTYPRRAKRRPPIRQLAPPKRPH